MTRFEDVNSYVEYSASVARIQDSFAFIMEYMDKVEGPPTIKITPYTLYVPVADPEEVDGDEDLIDDDREEVRFGVVVAGSLKDGAS